jgi:hypothetical protein
VRGGRRVGGGEGVCLRTGVVGNARSWSEEGPAMLSKCVETGGVGGAGVWV